MPIALGGIVTKRLRTKARRVRVKRLSKSIELAAREELVRRVDELHVHGLNKELILTAPIEQVVNYMSSVKENWRRMYEKTSETMARKWVGAVSARQKTAFEEGLAKLLRADFAVILDTQKVHEATLAAAVEASELIKTIPQKYAEDIQLAVLKNYQGIPFPNGRTLADELEERYNITHERAIIIARDQTAKINTAVTKARCLDMGANLYVWITREDMRVVGNPVGLYPRGNTMHGDHFARHGQTFDWNEPPHDGPPGYAINCRCFADPIIEAEKIKRV